MPAGNRYWGKGGGLMVQFTGTSQTVYVPLATLRVTHDPRLAEDTESDDLGSHFSPSGAMVPQAEIMLHRRDDGYPELIGLVPGCEIYRVWAILGGLRVGTAPGTPRAHLLFRTTVGAVVDDIQEIAPNLPITIPLQGGTMWRHVAVPNAGVVVPASPALPV